MTPTEKSGKRVRDLLGLLDEAISRGEETGRELATIGSNLNDIERELQEIKSND